MPLTEEQEAAEENLRRMMQTPQENDAQSAVKDADADFTPIPASALRGDPVTVTAGPLSFNVKPLTRKKIREFAELLNGWPEVLLFAAAVPKPGCPGIDHDATAALMDYAYQDQFQRQKEAALNAGLLFGAEPPATITADDVADMTATLTDSLDKFDSAIIASLRLFADPIQILTDEEWSERLDDLEIPDFADLLRGLKLANGRYKGSFSDRFTTP